MIVLVKGFFSVNEARVFADWINGLIHDSLTIWMDCRHYDGLDVRTSFEVLAMVDKLVVTVSGFDNSDEASQFISWYEGQGEQEIVDHLDICVSEGKDTREYLDCNVSKTYPLSLVNNTYTMYVGFD